MRVSIDPDVCQGHGLCVDAVPAVFVMNSIEHAIVQVEEVPPELQGAVHMAVVLCPEEAITISEQ